MISPCSGNSLYPATHFYQTYEQSTDLNPLDSSVQTDLKKGSRQIDAKFLLAQAANRQPQVVPNASSPSPLLGSAMPHLFPPTIPQRDARKDKGIAHRQFQTLHAMNPSMVEPTRHLSARASDAAVRSRTTPASSRKCHTIVGKETESGHLRDMAFSR